MKPLHVMAVVAGLILLAMGGRKLMSKNAVDLIKKHEGLRLTRYLDVAGIPTIGYGHRILPGENFTTITKAQAEQLLLADIARIEREIMPAIKRPLSENQKAAVLCFAFNVGANAFKTSTMLTKINAGDMAGAAAEFDRWNKARVNGVLQPVAGLTKRRAEEKALFLA